MSRVPLDLAVLADNGLRRGRTTGTCATAAFKAALLMLLHRSAVSEVTVSLPDSRYCLVVPIREVTLLADDVVRAEVVKDAGDDPDCTDRAVIFVVVRINHCAELRFLAGAGVGTVTEPGIRVPIGEPAINPMPRQMMRWAAEEVLAGAPSPGFDLEIGCEDGEAIARKTFNPRLGIVGGISILGTTGIVEPMSLAAYVASIEVYIRVALGGGADSVAYAPGKIGTTYARRALQLPQKRVVQISNFIGFALDCTNLVLAEEQRRLPVLWLVGHPGKLAKTLDNIWDTHSTKSPMAMTVVAQVADECGFSQEDVQALANANTVEAAVTLLGSHPRSRELWSTIESRIAAVVLGRLKRVDRVEARLFGLHGIALGQAA
ncbi:MAG TPA: cobalt-precorrin-5B (C(1))-methyltransferase CbiD [Steroidobacteraceae bacterium]